MIEVYTDGASRGNPGKSGAGVYIKSGNENFEHAMPLPIMSNHEAEFHAVIWALEICQEMFPNEIISLRSDAQVIVDIINKNHTKNEAFLPLLEKAQLIIATFPLFFIKWIPQSQNKNADQLARKAIFMGDDS